MAWHLNRHQIPQIEQHTWQKTRQPHVKPLILLLFLFPLVPAKNTSPPVEPSPFLFSLSCSRLLLKFRQQISQSSLFFGVKRWNSSDRIWNSAQIGGLQSAVLVMTRRLKASNRSIDRISVDSVCPSIAYVHRSELNTKSTLVRSRKRSKMCNLVSSLLPGFRSSLSTLHKRSEPSHNCWA